MERKIIRHITDAGETLPVRPESIHATADNIQNQLSEILSKLSDDTKRIAIQEIQKKLESILKNLEDANYRFTDDLERQWNIIVQEAGELINYYDENEIAFMDVKKEKERLKDYFEKEIKPKYKKIELIPADQQKPNLKNQMRQIYLTIEEFLNADASEITILAVKNNISNFENLYDEHYDDDNEE